MEGEDAQLDAARKKGLWAKLKTFVREGSGIDGEHAEIVRRPRPVYYTTASCNSSDTGSCTSGEAASSGGHRPKRTSGLSDSVVARSSHRSAADSCRSSASDGASSKPVVVEGAAVAGRVGQRATRHPADGDRVSSIRACGELRRQRLSGAIDSRSTRQDADAYERTNHFTKRQLFDLVASAAAEALPLRINARSQADWWRLLLLALQKKYGRSKTAALASQLMQRPEVLAALQGKIQGFVKEIQLASLPTEVKRRVKALKKLQAASADIESKFYKEMHELERKFNDAYTPLYDKRKDILAGTYEPTDTECEWPTDEEDADDEEAIASQIKDKLQLKQNDDKDDPAGIPFFWLTVLRSVDLLDEMIQECDEPILHHLVDIRVKYSSEPMGFTLEFHFSPNEYFSDSVLTKWYEMSADADDPLRFDGPVIVKCKGCAINWSKGKDVTVKLVKKKQKHKGRGTTRMVTKTVKTDSFFNFFSPPEIPEGEDEEMEDETEALIERDFEIGQFIRERIVSRAVLYFTGEEADTEVEEEEEEGDEDAEGDDDYDEDEDPDYDPAKDTKARQANKQECKQQ